MRGCFVFYSGNSSTLTVFDNIMREKCEIGQVGTRESFIFV